MKEELLRLENLTVRYSGHGVVSAANLLMCSGECFTVMGLDNSGRNALCRLFCGCGQVESGSLYVHKKPMDSFTRNSFETADVYFVDLNVAFLSSLDLSENFFLLRRNKLKKCFLNQKAIHLRTQRIMEDYGLDCSAYSHTSELSLVDRILIALIRAADQGAKLLVLSQVSDVFSHSDLPRLVRLLGQLKNQGIGLLISDNRPEVFEVLTDCLVVMSGGEIEKKIFERGQYKIGKKIVLEGLYDRIDANSQRPFRQSTADREKIIRYENICLNGQDRFSIEASKGEILLITALDSQEQEKLWQLLSGNAADQPDVLLNSVHISCGSKDVLLRNRVAFWGNGMPSNEILTNLSVRDNVLLPSLRRISRPFGLCRKRIERIFEDATFFEDRFDDMNPGSLSENERSLIILNRWKLFNPSVFILHNILSSADAVGRLRIRRGLLEMAARGTAVILMEIEADFCAKFADEIRIVSGGQMSDPLSAEDLKASEWNILLKLGNEAEYEK
jgi:ABC-type sugar transport system, ATPase component